MNRPFLVIAGLALFFLACKEKNQTADSDPASDTILDSLPASKQYFPVADFLKSEIAYVDSLPVGIKKYRTIGSRMDSGYIKAGEFHKLASEFLPQELTDSQFMKSFEETAFMDKSSNAGTFYYSTKNQNSRVRRVDVVTAKGDIYDEVKSIYIEKSYQQGDSFLIKKLIWKPKRNFQIITMVSTGSDELKKELIKVVWDNRE